MKLESKIRNPSKKLIETSETSQSSQSSKFQMPFHITNLLSLPVRGYRGMLCEDAWSDVADLRPREPLANNIRFAGESVGMRRYPI
jgi:hypothetical protein